jgi:hypothetical protein
VLAVEMRAASLFALAQVRHAQIAVVAHVSNATDHEGEPFNRGSEKEGVEILTAICRAGLIASETVHMTSQPHNDENAPESQPQIMVSPGHRTFPPDGLQ